MDGNKEIIVVYEINYEYVLYDFSEENYTLYNTVEKPVKSAILKGNTVINLYGGIDGLEIFPVSWETFKSEFVQVQQIH